MKPNTKATPRKSGSRNTRILAMLTSQTPSSAAHSRIFAVHASSPTSQPDRPAAAGRHAERREQADQQREVEHQLQVAGGLDQREVAAGIFQHHRLVDHGELEMGRRVVDRNARILGQRHDDERDQGQRQRDAHGERLGDEEVRHAGQPRRAGGDGERQHDQHHGRLGQGGDHHLARRADAAEAGADVHAGQRQQGARGAQQRHQRHHVGRPVEHQARRRSSAPGPPPPRSGQRSGRARCGTATRRCRRRPLPCARAWRGRDRPAATARPAGASGAP